MAGVLYLAVFVLAGIYIVRLLLPGQQAVYRLWLGTSFGVFLLMWLPALVAFVLSFSVTGHLLALPALAALVGCAWLARDQKTALRRFDKEDAKVLRLLLFTAVPLTLLGAYLQWTHYLRPSQRALHTGQSTYGDLPLHLGIITSLRDVRFPADYSILPGQQLSYPFLSDSLSTSFLLLGMGLRAALVFPGTLMMALVFSGYALLASRMASSRRAAALATLLLFLNGGLGFLYSLDMLGTSLGGSGLRELQQGVFGDRLRTILEGWYQTPANHAEFGTYNLRWSNIVADMLVPQRSFLGGWTVLLPCIFLLYDSIAREGQNLRAMSLLGLMAGGLPLLHTHSFLALGLLSAGWLAYSLLRRKPLLPWLLYALIALALAAPQLFLFTFRQASASETFLRFQFNWVNNPSGTGLRDGYLWFYLKNIGLPFALLLLSLFEKNTRYRMIFSGAFVIFVTAELILFQPNEYDNNKLFYVWYALCAVPIAETALSLWERLKGLRARPLVAATACVIFFASGSLSIARECLSDYRMFSREDVRVAEYVEVNTQADAVFLCWTQHINPVSALAGRRIVCGPALWLYYHGFDLSAREEDIRAFYADPAGRADVLLKYDVGYILVGPNERAALRIDEAALGALFERVYPQEGDSGDTLIFRRPEG